MAGPALDSGGGRVTAAERRERGGGWTDRHREKGGGAN